MITLITDFGLTSEYVGVMKGVILSHARSAVIVDINHSVPGQNIVQAAYMIRSSFSYFPQKTVHVIVVDPGVGSERRVILLEAAGHRFLVPDNGVATLLVNDFDPGPAYEVSRRDLFLQPVSPTFHGRDIFAPVAAMLDGGMESSGVGPEIKVSELVKLQLPGPVLDRVKGEISGEVICVDSFGSLISNISRDNIIDCGYHFGQGRFSVVVGGLTIDSLSCTYHDVKNGCPLALIGSRDFLEIAVNGGNAARELHLSTGIKVTVSLR